MEQATRILSFQIETQKEKIKMTPTELKGYEKAQAVFAETRASIRGNFGANV